MHLSAGYLYKEHGFRKFSVPARFCHVSVSKYPHVDFADFEAFFVRTAAPNSCPFPCIFVTSPFRSTPMLISTILKRSL